MARQFNEFDDWANHKPTERRSNNNLDTSWKKRDSEDEGHICIIIHKRPPYAVYQHQFPTYVTYEDKKTGQPVVAFYSRPHTCWEPEEVVAKQFHRDTDGAREVEPTECPMCMMLEWLYQQMLDGAIQPNDAIFRFEGATDTRNNVTLTAAGLTGIFNAKRLPEHIEDHRHGFPAKTGYTMLAAAKCKYVLTVVDYDHPNEGVVNMCEGAAVGEGIKQLFQTYKKRYGDKGNFIKSQNPLMIEFNKKLPPKDMYKVTVAPSDQVPLTPAHRAALEKEPPELGDEYEPFDPVTTRAFMEKYAVIDMPWDQFFGSGTAADSFEYGENAPPAKQVAAKQEVKQLPAKDADPRKQPEATRPFTTQEKAAVKDAVAKANAVPRGAPFEMEPCEACGKPFDVNLSTCPHCGTEYEVD